VTLALAFCLLLLTVPAAGGRLSRVGELRLRWIWVAVCAFLVQVVIVTVAPGGDTVLQRIVHVATYVAVGAVVLRNLDVRFVWVVGLGGLLNLVAIVANGGVMPASRSALETAGLEVRDGAFANSDYVENASLGFLGDVFAVPEGWPGANVFSVGDVLILLGALLVIHAAAGSRLVAARPARRPRVRGGQGARQPSAPRAR
jgi:Family of unknown function (DUF5317)